MKRKWWVIAGVMAVLVVAFALVRTDSRQLWSREFPGSPIAAVLTPDGRVAVAVGSSLEAHDRSGHAEHLLSLPYGVADLISSADGHLFAVAVRRLQRKRVDVLFKLAWNGEVKWQHTNEGTIQLPRATPSGGAAYISHHPRLVVLDERGAELWREPLGGSPPHYAMGTAGQVAFVRPSAPIPMSSVLAQSARAQTSTRLPDDSAIKRPTAQAQLALIGTQGNRSWTQPAAPSSSRLCIDPEGRIAISEIGRLKLFNADGILLWEVNFPDPTKEAKAWLAQAPISYRRSLDSLVADGQGNLFCQERSGFIHAYSVEGKHRWSYWAAGGSASDDGLQPTAGGNWLVPFNDWRLITNRTANPPTGRVDYFSEARGLICLNDRGEELWRCKLSGGLTSERPKTAFEWRAAWARRFGLRESLHFRPPLVTPDGTIYQIASGRGRSWIFALRGDAE